MREMSDALADTKVSMMNILLKLQVSATRAGNHEMAAWAAKRGQATPRMTNCQHTGCGP